MPSQRQTAMTYTMNGRRDAVQTQTASPSPQASTRQSGNTASRSGRSPSLRAYNPATAGANVTGSVGALEAEFLVAIVILAMLMFTSGDSYENKIMSFMKRGALMCGLFFSLALISSGGPNAARIAKAFGALVIVAILLTSPVQTVITDIDNIIKNDWVGSSETGNDTAPASADSGTNSSTINPNAYTLSPGPNSGSPVLNLPINPASPVNQSIINGLNTVLGSLGLPKIP